MQKNRKESVFPTGTCGNSSLDEVTAVTCTELSWRVKVTIKPKEEDLGGQHIVAHQQQAVIGKKQRNNEITSVTPLDLCVVWIK